MTFKRGRIIVLVSIVAIISMLTIAKCVPEVSAEPIGPITIETHLAKISSNMQLIKWIGGILIGLVSIISSLVVYIFMSTVSNLKASIGHVEKKAEKALKKTDHIEETFMSISTHDRICKDGN